MGTYTSRKTCEDLGKWEVSFTLGIGLVNSFKIKGMLKINLERNPNDIETFLHVVK